MINIAYVLCPAFALVAPPLVIGVIRKIKARMQNRIGAPVFQPWNDLCKFFLKSEVISEHASWVLRGASTLGCATAVLLLLSVPWFGSSFSFINLDVISFVYMMVLIRLCTLLIGLDPNSSFGGFGSSREAFLAVLVEPAVMMCLISLAIAGKSTSLSSLFSYSDALLAGHLGLWILCGAGLFLSSLVELSRMPADDPTTHLELTMVHEAMMLENSGPNLAAVEYTEASKLAVLLGLSGQCFAHAMPFMWHVSPAVQTGVSVLVVLVMASLVAGLEAAAVKLRWTKLPEFVGYAFGAGMLCVIQSIGVH